MIHIERRNEESGVEQTGTELGQALSLAMDLGKSMVKCGAEINRVEETIIRVCYAYGMKRVEVFSIISMMTATAFDENGRDYTQSRRIYSYSNNLGRLERLNALSRKICQEVLPVSSAREELEKINGEERNFRFSACLGNSLAAAAFAIFFGGTWRDALATVPIATMIYLMNSFIKAKGMNRLFFTAVCSALSGFFAILFVRLGLADNADMIMIGDIMLIIPGLMLINSLRELLCGDVMSGLMRFLETLIIALSIACGFAVPILLIGG